MKIDVMKLQPLTGYVLIEPAEKESVTSSGIVLPTDSGEKPQYGKILAVGAPGKDDPKFEAKKGDTVVYKKWGGNEIKIDDIAYQILKYEDVIAKVG